MSGGTLHQDEMGGGRGEDGATYRCRVNGVAGEGGKRVRVNDQPVAIARFEFLKKCCGPGRYKR